MTSTQGTALGLLVAVVVVILAAWALNARAQGDASRWNCAAEDEVVVIDHTCRHIDELSR